MPQSFEHPDPATGARQVTRGYQSVVAAADDDDVKVPHGLGSTGVALYLPLGAHLRVVGVGAAGAKRAALPQQVPALVQLHLDGAQSAVFFGFVDLVVLQLVPQFAFGGDEVVHLAEDVLVVGHATSVPRRATGATTRCNDRMTERTAVVTGASGGIGLAITRALREEGFAVTMVARDPAKLAAAVAAVSGGDAPPVTSLAGSVADESFLDQIVAHTASAGSLDLLVNNAGVSGHRAVGDITADFLDHQLAVNLRAVILLTDKCLGLLKSAVRLRGSAQVVNTASNAGKRGEATLSSYSATKAAVVGFTEALHDELATSGIRATAVCPGLVDTPMADPFRDTVAAATMISPRDVAEVVRMTTRLSTACIVPEIVLLRPTEWLQPDEVRPAV